MRNCSQRVSIAIALSTLASIAAAGQSEQKSNVVELRVEKEILPAPVRYEMSRTVDAGRVRFVSMGKPGSSKRLVRVTLKNGKVVLRELLKEERVEPTPSVYAMGKAGLPTSRGSYSRSRILDMEATAYTPGASSNGRWAGRTRTGRVAEFGVVAVDPRVIPLGSMVYVEGYGLAIAADTGSAIKGARIDICFNQYSTAMNYGRRRVKVHVFSGR